MKKISIIFVLSMLAFACSADKETTFPTNESITESVYASGYIKSKNQYAVFPKVNGIVEHVYVSSGDQVIQGSPLISIYNETQEISNQNARLTANFYDFNANVSQLNELKNQISIAETIVKNDSLQYERQLKLEREGAGTAVELEGSELAYKNSVSRYKSAQTQYTEYKRQLSYNSAQAQKNLQIAGAAKRDFTVFSEIEGKVYSIDIEKGEMVNVQTQLAIIGDENKFILEMQIDEKDILRTQVGQKVIVTLDSYHDQTFEATITKIHPIMNIKSRSFLIEAEFIEQPEILYPNLNFQANIIINSKENVVLIPREYLVNDTTVLNKLGESLRVRTGLKDFRSVEILDGLSIKDEILKP
jgi:multidrug efflux pump subunit AcrA (membrane-fusion protein)